MGGGTGGGQRSSDDDTAPEERERLVPLRQWIKRREKDKSLPLS
jgi:hypothetical protein